MKRNSLIVVASLLAAMLTVSHQVHAQRATDQFINTLMLEDGSDELTSFAIKELYTESDKKHVNFEIVALKRLDNVKKSLIMGLHQVPADQKVNGLEADFKLDNMIASKDEAKFYAVRFPQYDYQFIVLDEMEVRDFLEKVKQLRSNYIESDTLKIKKETHFYQYRFNKDLKVSMSLGKDGSSAKYFEIWIGKRRQVINSDKFILYLTEFLEY